MKTKLGLGLISIALLALTGCDMTFLDRAAPGMNTRDKGTGDEDKIAELQRNGHYLMLYHLPSGTFKEAIKGVSVSDGSNAVAFPEADILIAPDAVYINAYIPLAAASGGAFTRSGNFIVAFTVQIDALTKITVSRANNVIVPFTDGKGTLDIEKLLSRMPDVVELIPDPDVEREIEEITAEGGYIHFYNLPRNVSKNSFSAISVSSMSGVIGTPENYEAIAVRKNVLTSEAFVPLAASRDGRRFQESGSFYVAFTVTADALIQIVVQPSYAALYLFNDSGAASVDVSNAPYPPSKPPVVPHCLTIGGLPSVTSPANVFDVLVYNSAGIVAKCPDYTKLYMTPYNGRQTAVVPLVYDNNKAFNGKDFAESGNFIVAFTVYPEAGQMITVTVENNCLVFFNDGSAFLDISNVPPVPRNCLTVTNLPANFQELNLTGLYVWNQKGKVAQCQSYNLLEIIRQGGSSMVRIPLVYADDDARLFAETGPYYVTFDMNVDALTRIIITEADKVLAFFTDGNAVLDAAALPQALPLPYFTIIGLPRNTVKGNFSEVFLYNMVGKVAKCPDYQTIFISRGTDSATAMIPLAYNENGKEYFRDSGQFVVTFTVNVDINTQISKTRADSFTVEFTDGSGELDLSSDYGYFSGSLVNPSDTAAPVLKSGMVFEMNGSYVKLQANTAVQAAEFSSTRIVYVYAVKNSGNLSFVYSDAAPVWSTVKKAWYQGDRRALYKLVYLKDTGIKFVAKQFMGDEWARFDRYPVENIIMGNVGNQQIHALSGASNPATQTYNAASGWYIFDIKGAGGGGGGGIDGNGSNDYYGGWGGQGGSYTELVYVDAATSVTLFTGSGGYGSGYISYGSAQGTGGGGGGSGTFVYTQNGYFLCAGGGGGGSGASVAICGAGGGGAGGSIGSGGGGGVGGSYGGGAELGIVDAVYETVAAYFAANGYISSIYLGSYAGPPSPLYGSVGGKGGGLNGGNGGSFSFQSYGNKTLILTTSTGNGGAFLSATHFGYSGSTSRGSDKLNGRPGGNAAYSQYGYPDEWKNTVGVNGSGGNDPGYSTNGSNGAQGGNNRNAVRGGGSSGGSRGVPSDSPSSSGGQGGHGSIVIYKL